MALADMHARRPAQHEEQAMATMREIARLIALPFLIGMIAVFPAGSAVAQGGTPVATPAAKPVITLLVPLFDADGKQVGTAKLDESRDLVVTISVIVAGLAPGPHGIHIHESGRCDPTGTTPFPSAGAHFNPTDGTHGGPDDPEAHAGDLGNVDVGPDGKGELERMTTKVTLSPGPVTLADADGSALVIHADRDDLETDPDGNSGARIACGVIFSPEGTPVATPAATPAA
jgi:Cu-Zn family superoxide dismutase